MKAKKILFIAPTLLLFSSIVSCNNNTVSLTGIKAEIVGTYTTKLTCENLKITATNSDKSTQEIQYVFQNENSYVVSVDDQLVDLSKDKGYDLPTEEKTMRITYKTFHDVVKVKAIS